MLYVGPFSFAEMILFLIMLNKFADSFQGHTLGKDVGDTSQGGGLGHHLSRVSDLGINRYGDLREAWVAV